MKILEIALFVILWAFFPGIFLTINLAKRRILEDELDAAAFATIFSITGNYLTIWVLNKLHVFPPLFLIPIALSAVGVLINVRLNSNSISLKKLFHHLARVSPAALLGGLILIRSHEPSSYVAPNADAFNHNFWIRRISEINSVISSHVKVDSPLAPMAPAGGRYPFGWHSSVAVWEPLTRVSVPNLSLFSMIFAWSLILPLGLLLLSRLWFGESDTSWERIGIIAGLIVQLVPLVPGEPLSWGSMTSVIGIALLPAVVTQCIRGVSRRELSQVITALFLIYSLVVIHTPEAASALAVTGAVFMFLLPNLRKAEVAGMIGFLGTAGVIGYRLYGGFLESASSYWGAVFPSLNWAVGSLFTLSINTYGDGISFLILLLFGIPLVSRSSGSKYALATLASLTLIYLISGAFFEPFSRFRIISTPWYGSYERTLWVLVPFACVVMAAPFCFFIERPTSNRFAKISKVLIVIFSAFVLAQTQVSLTLQQLSDSPLYHSMVSSGDAEVYEFAHELSEGNKVVLTLGHDSGSYGYMFEGLPVTMGLPINSDGVHDDFLALAHFSIKNLCAVPMESRSEITSRVSGVLLGARVAGWSAVGVSAYEAMNLPGLEVLKVGPNTTYAKINFQSCGQ